MDYPNDQAPGAPVRSGIPEHGRIPKYYAVKARIAALLEELGEGGVIPTERDLAERYDVARETVRQAVRELVLERRLRRRGRGTVVAGPKLAQPLSLASYTEGVRRQGRTPGRTLVTLDRFPCPDAPYAAGLVTKAPHSENGEKLLDFMPARKQQQEVSEIGGGFSARKDVKATDANAIVLTRLMDGVEVFEPDWNDIDKNLTSYVEDWKSATGS
ncbi:GntR family transcriptional regulator [Streptomyces sp. NPDC053086]|uniref:GntR family transcriptional regulator n=1 Tax=unclassified Streptomyces TaxID=2593676 RepID=UPI0037D113AD